MIFLHTRTLIKFNHLLSALFFLLISGPLVASEARQLSLIAWNIWFDDKTGKQRYPQILDVIEQYDADVVALQEVTPAFLQLYRRHQIAKKYHLAQSNPRANYQNITLSKAFPSSVEVIQTPSDMQRKALLLELEGYPMIVNVHLESGLRDTWMRQRQLNTVFEYVTNEDVIIAGDFNYGDGALEEEVFPNGYTDIGKAIGKTDPTYDIDNNKWAKETKYWFENSRRLDRVYNKINGKYQIDQFLYSDNGLSDHTMIYMKITYSL